LGESERRGGNICTTGEGGWWNAGKSGGGTGKSQKKRERQNSRFRIREGKRGAIVVEPDVQFINH
jgi:hypothetical protein